MRPFFFLKGEREREEGAWLDFRHGHRKVGSLCQVARQETSSSSSLWLFVGGENVQGVSGLLFVRHELALKDLAHRRA